MRHDSDDPPVAAKLQRFGVWFGEKVLYKSKLLLLLLLLLSIMIYHTIGYMSSRKEFMNVQNGCWLRLST